MKEMWWREEVTTCITPVQPNIVRQMDVLTRQARFSPDGEFLILAGAGKCVIYYTDSGERAGELPVFSCKTGCTEYGVRENTMEL